jgi:hypothetical protein
MNEMQIGKAGEYLVCADLIVAGYTAYLSEQGLGYDVVLDTGKSLLKIQVKTANKTNKGSRLPSYQFRTKNCGKKGKQAYTSKGVDLFALVVLQTKQISYLTTSQACGRPTILRTIKHKGQYPDEKSIPNTKAVLQKRKEGLAYSRIASDLGLSIGWVWQVCNGLRGARKKQHPYLEEMTIQKALEALANGD